MKRINHLVLFVFALTVSVSSCKKEESTSDIKLPTSKKEKDMLTSVSWTMTSHIENGVIVNNPDCEKDDIFIFLANGTYSHDIGAVICRDETNSSGTWSLSLDKNYNFIFNGVPMWMEITKSKLVLFQSNSNWDYDVTTGMTFSPTSPVGPWDY